jgi:hypothetical protein
MIGLDEIGDFAKNYAVSMARSYLYAIRDAGYWQAEEESLANPRGFFGALRTLEIDPVDFYNICSK